MTLLSNRHSAHCNIPHTLAGRLVLDNMDCERTPFCIIHNVSNGDIGGIRNVIASLCSATVALASTNTAGNLLLEGIQGSCTKNVLNGQSGGVDFVGAITKQKTCVSGACT